ncbi:FAD-linked oxidoreductase [Rhizobium sp. SG_E_25_P2]|uniref:D-arabinono-1,4-lactone oxidase n=1 Tax=Rhizobium sp. SG_E_25_P2 TaxID=2879942 RepID=UPI002474FED7|nr:D-arabinono-1,4-lactone oxidase [Rhizobium sp. SG_E_25_P2]MDH6264910.1 FAD-linked oxidoreductase [Rhizobium sp. SG_E_25_P2]
MNAPQPWSNWSGYVTARPQRFDTPRTVEALQDIVTSAPGPIRVVGSGHSFTPLVPSEGTIVCLDHIEGLVSHDAENCRATVRAGTKLGALTRILDGVDQALANMGDIDKQSIGGALGTATHGTGSTLGAYHTLLHKVELIDGRGQRRVFTRDADGDMMNAIGVSLGAFGILSEVTLNNLPTYRMRKRRWVLPIGDMIANFHSMMTAHRSAEFYFVPYSGHAMFLASDITDEPATSRPPEDDEDGLKTLKLARNLLKWFPWLRRKLISDAMRKLPREDFVENWLKVYTSDRQTRFNEMEYHLPVEEGPKALAEIINLTEKHFPEVYFPMEVRMVGADDIWLSPFYKRQTCSIAIHHDAAEDPIAFQRAAEPIFRRYGGRPHWGKMHTLTGADFAKLYPRWKDAMDVRRMLDPDGRFVSPYIKRLIET